MRTEVMPKPTAEPKPSALEATKHVAKIATIVLLVVATFIVIYFAS